MSKSTPLLKTAGLVSSPDFFGQLGRAFKRSPITMRKLCHDIEPVGFSVSNGQLRYYFTREQLSGARSHFKKNPPKGSGRPKGSTRKGGRK